MRQTKDAIAFLLNEYLKFIKKLDDGDLAKILDATSKIEFSLYEKGQKRKSSKATRRAVVEESDLRSLSGKLRQYQSREEGEILLGKERLLKADLQRLAKLFGVSVASKDTVALLKQNIINAAIGYRLDSNAIRGIEI